jgi:hypothetical protein
VATGSAVNLVVSSGSTTVTTSATYTGLDTTTLGAWTGTSALQVSNGSSSRIASVYYSATSININLNLTDGNTHRIALYLPDDESTGHTNRGSWNVTGNVIIQVTKTTGVNAVVSGIFLTDAAR